MRRLFLPSVCALALLGSTTSASAATIGLTVGDAYYLGHLEDGIPSSEAAEVGYISTLITMAAGATPTTIGTETYDRVSSTLAGPFATPLLAGALKNDSGAFAGIGVAGFRYILGKYDAHNPGAGSYVWLVSSIDAGDTVSLPSKLPGPSGYGLSHYTLFTASSTASVPDGGATAGLLGLALFGIGYLRRRIG